MQKARLYYIGKVSNHGRSKKSADANNRCRGKDDKVSHTDEIKEVEERLAE